MLINSDFNYLPILSVSPSEMKALKELPNKSKDEFLPLFPIKGWLASHHLEKTISRIEDSYGKRNWIADIDSSFIRRARQYDGDYPRPVFKEVLELIDSTNGYENWCTYIEKNENLIPTLIMEDLTGLVLQTQRFNDLNRGLVVKFNLDEMNARQFQSCLESLSHCQINNGMFVLDFGDINKNSLNEVEAYLNIIRQINDSFRGIRIAICSTSFPYSFSGQNHGEISIYERQLFQKLSNNDPKLNLIYSDHGSARAGKAGGGSGTPPPRIDYSLKNDWMFIREEFEDSKDIMEGEKSQIYKDIAIEIMKQSYWMENLKLWGSQMIELTSKGDKFGITSAKDATSVRINLHLYQQLNYFLREDEMDTDEDWVD